MASQILPFPHVREHAARMQAATTRSIVDQLIESYSKLLDSLALLRSHLCDHPETWGHLEGQIAMAEGTLRRLRKVQSHLGSADGDMSVGRY